ncbi:unnamed protein product [Acanthoscelides obtectus]|uniref:Uncharacterized protein n=1 Tax=Acanthoscelides obtectus TaxID=200917 RepID=A0A9P0PZV6_ACAOB|nr:unnamed protein product [Acanthoscelides obtectus]CAK1675340.1 hypothetical protein AOBTE_LOCUS30147 [Acanthoscelides obtectus]
MAGNEAGHGAIVRNRDLIDVWIEAPRGNRKQVVYEKILSLIDIRDEPSKHLKKVDSQELLQKTAESILEIINFEERDYRIKVICKWGFDGSSGHSQYKQKFSDLENTDEFLFLVAMTPLRLIDMETNKVLWKNESPSSTLYCRPIKFLFKKENADLVRNTEKEIVTKI